jgi:hypothetical protein
MTIDEFQNKFRKNKRFDKYWYHGLCFAVIIFSLFMLYSLVTDTNIKIVDSKTFHFTGFIFLLLLGIYGLFVLRNHYNLTYWNNNLTKDKNLELLNSTCSEFLKGKIKLDDNYAYFIYKKSWWRTSYEVHLFADNNLIAINVEGLDTYDRGFIDFGASKRTQIRILSLLKTKAENF